jgi:hypothetical protein
LQLLQLLRFGDGFAALAPLVLMVVLLLLMMMVVMMMMMT